MLHWNLQGSDMLKSHLDAKTLGLAFQGAIGTKTRPELNSGSTHKTRLPVFHGQKDYKSPGFVNI